MVWYYAKDGQQQGPFEEAAFRALAESGQVRAETLVWSEDMQDWRPYGEVKLAPAQLVEAEVLEPEPMRKSRSAAGVVHPEGFDFAGARYAGFWVRALARMIDSMIMFFVTLAAVFVFAVFVAVFFPEWVAPEKLNTMTGTLIALQVVSHVIAFVIPMFYETWMVSRWGATLGKMACGIRIVGLNAPKLTYRQAFVRYWGYMLSGLIFCIGYAMAAFDEEKRSLHDRLCHTRVVYTLR